MTDLAGYEETKNYFLHYIVDMNLEKVQRMLEQLGFQQIPSALELSLNPMMAQSARELKEEGRPYFELSKHARRVTLRNVSPTLYEQLLEKQEELNETLDGYKVTLEDDAKHHLL